VEEIEYRPQRGVGVPTLIRACVTGAVAVGLLSLGVQFRAAFYLAAFPAVIAIPSFAAYASSRRLRTRLTAEGIESRRLRTWFIPWAQIRDTEVVSRVTVTDVPVMGNRASGRYGSRSGAATRKEATIRVQQASGRWRELAMPAVWGNAPDPDFTSKARAIEDRWRAATGQAHVN
jgi:hypothetical protein